MRRLRWCVPFMNRYYGYRKTQFIIEICAPKCSDVVLEPEPANGFTHWIRCTNFHSVRYTLHRIVRWRAQCNFWIYASCRCTAFTVLMPMPLHMHNEVERSMALRQSTLAVDCRMHGDVQHTESKLFLLFFVVVILSWRVCCLRPLSVTLLQFDSETRQNSGCMLYIRVERIDNETLRMRTTRHTDDNDENFTNTHALPECAHQHEWHFGWKRKIQFSLNLWEKKSVLRSSNVASLWGLWNSQENSKLFWELLSRAQVSNTSQFWIIDFQSFIWWCWFVVWCCWENILAVRISAQYRWGTQRASI